MIQAKDEIELVQIVVAQWQNNGPLTYSTLGLGKDGAVYRYDPQCHGWIRYSMKPAECGLDGHLR